MCSEPLKPILRPASQPKSRLYDYGLRHLHREKSDRKEAEEEKEKSKSDSAADPESRDIFS